MDLTKLTKPKLLAICKENNLSGYSNMKKNELIELLSPPVNTITDACAKPLLKWVGGKSQIINKVLEMFPTEFNHYHEPFVGGGSVLISLLMKQRAGEIFIHGTIYASDLNLALISMYKNVQSNPHEVIQELKRIISEYTQSTKGTFVNRDASTLEDAFTSSESYYYYTRRSYNSLAIKTTTTASAMFIFMNKTCFRGVYREGPYGFNVPYGNYSNPGIMDETHILFISELIKNVVFSHRTYYESLQLVNADDFVYLDPPYAPVNETSFVSYNMGGFKLEDHENLFSQCLQMTEKNVKFLLSNSNVAIVRDSFLEPVYQTTIISCRRTINSKDPAAKANEVLIHN
jgi:DNA adenine methylase